jgi:hypothetical protein
VVVAEVLVFSNIGQVVEITGEDQLNNIQNFQSLHQCLEELAYTCSDS